MSSPHVRASLYRNPLSYFGGLVTIGSALLSVFSLAVSFAMKQGSPYLGILTYLVFPAFMGLGVLIFLFGMHRESVRRRRLGAGAPPPYPSVDLNDPAQRKRFAYALFAGFFFVILLAFVSYHAFIFTESVTFCGRVCHTVMEPEYTAYLASPHARVRCVDCHVGSGASWYVKSKLSGARQVLAVVFHTYPTPIPVPVEEPAAGAGDLRGVPLAAEVLRRAAHPEPPLPLRRGRTPPSRSRCS